MSNLVCVVQFVVCCYVLAWFYGRFKGWCASNYGKAPQRSTSFQAHEPQDVWSATPPVRAADGSLLVTAPASLPMTTMTPYLERLEMWAKSSPTPQICIRRGRCDNIYAVGIAARERGYGAEWAEASTFENSGWLITPRR